MTAAMTQPPRPTGAQWLAGARPRTLPAALSPVIAASGLAFFEGGFSLRSPRWPCLVSVALQVGVNYANDYSDGVRGTDAVRVGPLRLVGSGPRRAPAAVKRAAFSCFGVAAIAGLIVVMMTGHWWLLAVGAACVLAAWYYTGGKRPYGYLGLGELFVFVFFGLVAVCGTALVRSALSRGRPVDRRGHRRPRLRHPGRQQPARHPRRPAVGKRTLATRLGDRGTRWFYVVFVALAAS